MKKKVIVILLCISSSSFGMDQPFLSYSIPDSVPKSVRYCSQALLLPNEEKIADILLDCVEHNGVGSLQYHLKDKAERVLKDSSGEVIEDKNRNMITLPDVLGHVLCHKKGASILHEAVKRSYFCCAQLLLAYNAHPNITIQGGDTPLHVATDGSIVQLLIDYGACIECKNDCGETPFFKSIKNACSQTNDYALDAAQILWLAGADVNASNKDNNSPLHYVVKYSKRPDIVQFLLYRGARIDCKNKFGETADQIIYKRRGAVLKAFRKWQKVFHTLNFTMEDNRSLSVMSLLNHNGRQLKKLLMRDTSDYCSPDIVVAEKLFKRCGDKIWNALKNVYSAEVLSLVRFVEGRSKLRACFLKLLRSNNFSVASELLKENPYLLHTYEGEYHKDEVNKLFVEKIISAHVSDIQYRYLQEMMYSGFFDVDVCDDTGTPVLSVVIQQMDSGDKYLDLLKAGVRVNVQDEHGHLPIFYAFKFDKKDVILQLLSYGAYGAYEEQKCCVCNTHDYGLSDIPCVNRHIRHFICRKCYKNCFGKCPICCHSLES